MKKNLSTLALKFALFVLAVCLTYGSSFAQWIEKADALKTRSEVAGVVYDSKLYTFLGFSNSALETEPSSEVYDPATDTWSLLASIPEGASVTHEGVVLVDNTVWIIGGRVGKNPGPLTSDIWIYNITENSWRRGPQITDPGTGEPLPWAAGGAVLLGRTLHIFGGFVINACDHDQSEYHLTLDVDSWLADASQPAKWANNLAPLPIKRNHFGTVTLGGKIYAIGGQFGHDCGGGQDKRYSHVYDPATNKWTELPLLPTQRSHIEGGVFAIDGKIYVVAGQGNGGRSTNYVTVFDPSANNGAGSWVQDASLTLPKSYEGVSAKVIGNTFIYSHGGEGASSNTRKATYSRTIVRNPVYKLGFSAGCLNLSTQQNSSVTGKTLLFTIDGSKDYTTSSSAEWLSVTKNSAGTAKLNATDIEVSANTAGLAPGNYNAVITATGAGDGPDYEAATYCFNLTVQASAPTADTLEAETAALNGVKIAANHPGFSGTGFVDCINPNNDYIEWSFYKGNFGPGVLEIRYANGRQSDRPMKLTVNGFDVPSALLFPSTGLWEKWLVSKVTVNLNAGTNTVRLTTIGSSGPNIDYLAVSGNSAQSANITMQQKKKATSTTALLQAHVTPNPASGTAKLVLTGASSLPVYIELNDISGRTYQKIKFPNNGTNTYDFSVKDLQSGYYIIKVMQGKSVKAVKLMVQNQVLQ